MWPPDHDQGGDMNVMEAHGLRKTYESEGFGVAGGGHGH